jgi:hypothetical protein
VSGLSIKYYDGFLALTLILFGAFAFLPALIQLSLHERGGSVLYLLISVDPIDQPEASPIKICHNPGP